MLSDVEVLIRSILLLTLYIYGEHAVAAAGELIHVVGTSRPVIQPCNTQSNVVRPATANQTYSALQQPIRLIPIYNTQSDSKLFRSATANQTRGSTVQSHTWIYNE